MKNDDPIQRLYIAGLVCMALGIVVGLLLGAIELYRLIPTIYAMVVANRLASVAIIAAASSVRIASAEIPHHGSMTS